MNSWISLRNSCFDLIESYQVIKFMNRLSYIVFICLARVLAALPLRVLYFFSDILYLFVFHILGYRKSIVYENLRNSFPQKSAAEIDIIARKFYRHFCDLFVEIIKMLHISEEEIKRRMTFSNPRIFDEDYAAGKHILMVISHYNNWEWLGTLALQTPYKIFSIYKPLTNKYFDDLMIRVRRNFGGDVVTMAKTGRFIVEKFKGEDPIILNFLCDQSPVITEIHYWTTFLNQDTPIYLGIEKLALRTKQPVYFGKPVKKKRGYYSIEIEKLCDDCSLLKPHEVTELHVRALERAILEAPQYWLWSHRRWKIKKTVSS